MLAVVAMAVAGCGQSGAVAANNESTPIAALALTGRVVDRANIINAPAEQALVERLAKLEQATSDQLVVVTVPSLEGQPVEKVALRLANRWGIGRNDVDNGVVVLIAPTERKVRIEVGLGLEGLLTDARAAACIRQMLPLFRQSRMADGISSGVDSIDRLLRSDLRRPQPKPASERIAA